MPAERRFTELEVREILKCATDEEVTLAAPAREGLSLAELRTIGEEVGIDPRRIEHAALSIARADAPGSGSDLTAGLPEVLVHERTVDGELVPSRRALVLSTIRRAMGQHGEVSDAGGSLEWRTTGGSVQRLVAISSNAGRTTIEGSTNLRQAIVGTYLSGGLISATLGGLGVASSVSSPEINVLGLAISLGFLGAALVGLRLFVRRMIRSESAKLARTVDELGKLTIERPE
jgi:hypothetical protein